MLLLLDGLQQQQQQQQTIYELIINHHGVCICLLPWHFCHMHKHSGIPFLLFILKYLKRKKGKEKKVQNKEIDMCRQVKSIVMVARVSAVPTHSIFGRWKGCIDGMWKTNSIIKILISQLRMKRFELKYNYIDNSEFCIKELFEMDYSICP